ncbi:MAG TPA: hypothetical protein VLA14_03240, partial [Polyangia bacterium]|nr:hypothetical protein [Polyangia bacterium]
MIRAARLAAPAFLFASSLIVGTRARAADNKTVAAEIEAHDQAFVAAYDKGETKKMKSEIGKAVSLGEKSGLGADPIMADTYVLAAVLEVDGNDNKAAGVKDFVKALKIKPDVAIPKGMATSPVKAALKQARLEAGLAPKDGAAPAAVVAAKTPAEASKEPAKEAAAGDKPDTQKAEQAALAKAREDAEANAKQQKELAAAKDNESKERGETDRLKKENADKEKQLADLKARAQQLEKDKADRDKQLADARGRIQQLEKDKADRDKQLGDAKARAQQLERDKADDDKRLADTRAQQGKEHEALEKIEQERQAAEARQRDAEAKEKQERQERERLFAGPELPSHPREALTCAVPDEAPLRTDLFVHCVARANLKARSIVFYYRTFGAHYYSVPMERTAKGWYAALVPGTRVMGKVLQYYAEALDGREAVVATNG